MKTIHRLQRGATTIFLSLLCVCGLTGCLSRPPMAMHTFMFNTPAVGTTNTVGNDRVLAIRSLQVAAPFDVRPLVYRTGEFSYVRDPYAAFLDVPTTELRTPIGEWFRTSGDFKDVVESGSAAKPNTLVEISVGQLYGDFRDTAHPQAVLAMRFSFFHAHTGIPGEVFLQRNYLRSIPITDASAAALMKGWDQALGEILATVSKDLQNPESEK